MLNAGLFFVHPAFLSIFKTFISLFRLYTQSLQLYKYNCLATNTRDCLFAIVFRTDASM